MPDHDTFRPDAGKAQATQALRRVAHDVNNPLAAVAMAAAALRTAPDDEQRERLIEIVEQQALRAGRIVSAAAEAIGGEALDDDDGDGRPAPLFQARDAREVRRSGSETASADTGPERGLALVVDDDEAIRALLVLALRQDGWRVTAVGDGGTAQAAVEQQPPDLLLLDLHLAGESGHDLADRLVALDVRLDDRIIYLSGDAVADENVGHRPALRKPFALADLRALADRLAPRQR